MPSSSTALYDLVEAFIHNEDNVTSDDLIACAKKEGVDSEELASLMRVSVRRKMDLLKPKPKRVRKKKEPAVDIGELLNEHRCENLIWWTVVQKDEVKDDIYIFVKKSVLNVRTIVNQNGFQPLERVQPLELNELKAFRIHFNHEKILSFSNFDDIGEHIRSGKLEVIDAYAPQVILDWLLT